MYYLLTITQWSQHGEYLVFSHATYMEMLKAGMHGKRYPSKCLCNRRENILSSTRKKLESSSVFTLFRLDQIIH